MSVSGLKQWLPLSQSKLITALIVCNGHAIPKLGFVVMLVGGTDGCTMLLIGEVTINGTVPENVGCEVKCSELGKVTLPHRLHIAKSFFLL